MGELDLVRISRECYEALDVTIQKFCFTKGMPIRVQLDRDIASYTDPNGQRYSFVAKGKLYSIVEPLDVAVIGFRPGDGTGDQKSHNIAGVPMRFTPRNKEGFGEIFIPLGTEYDGTFTKHLTSLDAVTTVLHGFAIKRYASLTVHQMDYDRTVDRKHTPEALPLNAPDMVLTFKEDSYGNPHAITFPRSNVEQFTSLDPRLLVQFGAFIPIRDDKLGKALIEHVQTSPTRVIK